MSLVHSGVKLYVTKLPHGGDLLDSIKVIAKKENIRAATFNAIGAVVNARLGYYDQKEKKYRAILFSRPMEIVSCIGNISELGGDITVHAHLILSDEKGMAFGGHLLEGTELFACELMINQYEDLRITRKYDELTGLNLMDI